MIVSWDYSGVLLWAHEAGQHHTVTALEQVDGVPQWTETDLPDEAPRVVVLPMESLLLRPVTLPLSHPRFIDSAILGQELEELAGIEAEAWWLAWQMERLDEGCSGVVFAMPLAMQQQLASHPRWSRSTVVTVDGWVRLQRWSSEAPSEQEGEDDGVAVVDADDSGLFFGYRRGGCWLGMRRLNGVSEEMDQDDCRMLAAQVVRSWRAMGWHGGPVIGRVDGAMHAALTEKAGEGQVVWHGQIEAALPDRLAANVDAVRRGEVALDFRHGRWAPATTGLGDWRLWRRSAALAGLVCLLWYGQQQMEISALQQQSAQLENGIAQAFHRGLPDQAVMLDPLGQLRVAAEKVGGDVDRQRLLRQMEVVAAVRKQVKWEVRGFQLRDGVVRLQGNAADLESLNKIHDLLQKAVGHTVTIEDTDLQKNSVGFRMRWS